MDNQQKARLFSIFVIFSMLLSVVGIPALHVQAATSITFTGSEMLGRPENTSITVKIVPNSTIVYHYQYGLSSGTYTDQTADFTAASEQPSEIVISGLSPNTHYFYRMQYHVTGESDWVDRAEHSFWTQRAQDSNFTFTITSDSHVNIMLGNATTWTNTLNHVVADHPDFEIDLGDTFAMDDVTTSTGAETAYKYQLQFFNLVSASSPIFLAAGNHEEQEGWHLDDTGDPATSKPVNGTNAQKKFYLNPVQDSFYSGDTSTYAPLGGDGLREDYYAWTWGDALFVVIDPFWFTNTKPFIGNTGGGETSDTGSGDRWDWTLGLDQFNWLKTTLETSNAKYKFMFAHHMTGGSDDYVRGGANPANLVEWGGYNEAGTVYEWETKRPGWGSEPIHQMMVANGVSAFFHGHDHQYAYEKRDGIVYQSLPSAGFSGNGFNIYSSGDRYTIQALPSPGHLRVSVTPTQTTVDYIATTDGAVNYSYLIDPGISGPTHVLTTSVNPAAGGAITPSAGTHTYSEGSEVTITASANSGYTFANWSGACTGTSPCQVTMDSDKTVTANFTALPTYVLTTAVSPTGGGTISPSAGNHTYFQGDIVGVTASANSGYTFANWSGSCTGTAPCQVTMNADKTVTANFTMSNAAPVAVADTFSTNKNVVLNVTAPGVLGNDTDANLDPLTAIKVSDPANGTLALNANGSFTYTPTTGFTGDDSFTYKAHDASLDSNTVTVTIHVNTVNPPGLPSSFYGEIHILTNPPSAGELVEAYVPGVTLPVASTAILNTNPLTYSIDVPGDVTGTPVKDGGVEGDVVTFKINEHVVATGIWHSGTSVRLDFNETTQSISLVSGWNLVSFNLHPANTDIADVLSSIAGHYDLVYAWNASTALWMKHDPNADFGDTLLSLDETMGFWINMNTADTLEINGSLPDTSTIALYTGWNLVGFPSAMSQGLPDAFSLNGVGSDFSLVYAYHAADTSDPWKKFDLSAPYGNDLTEIAPGWGYWVKLSAAHDWVVNN